MYSGVKGLRKALGYSCRKIPLRQDLQFTDNHALYPIVEVPHMENPAVLPQINALIL